MLDEGYCRWLGNTDARNQLALAQSQGLQTGDDPVVGGVICWWSENAGHCAVIEEIVNQNEVICTESGWSYSSAPIVRTYTHYRVNGAWQHIISGYTYQGIIYPPYTPSGGGSDDDYYMLWLQNERLKKKWS